MCRGLMGCALVIVNVVVLIIGIAIAAVGGILLWGKPLVRKFLDWLMERLQEVMQNQNSETIENMLNDLAKMAAPFGWVIFGVGIALIVVSLLAMIGVCCHVSICLIIYAVILGVLIIAHVLVLVIYFTRKDKVLGYIFRFLKSEMLKYKSLESNEPTSLLIGGVMTTLRCCGYYNGSDFDDPTLPFTHRDSISGRTFENISYPLPCCKPDSPDQQTLTKQLMSIQQKYPNITDQSQLLAQANQCPYKFTDGNSYIAVGCGVEAEKIIFKLADFVAYVSIGVLLLEVILFAFAVLIVVMRKKE